jgi:hypothetical protein
MSTHGYSVDGPRHRKAKIDGGSLNPQKQRDASCALLYDCVKIRQVSPSPSGHGRAPAVPPPAPRASLSCAEEKQSPGCVETFSMGSQACTISRACDTENAGVKTVNYACTVLYCTVLYCTVEWLDTLPGDQLPLVGHTCAMRLLTCLIRCAKKSRDVSLSRHKH